MKKRYYLIIVIIISIISLIIVRLCWKSNNETQLVQSYTNKGITVNFPDNWDVKNPEYIGDESVAIFLYEKSNELISFAYIIVDVPKKLDENYTLEEYARIINNNLTEEYGNIYIHSEGSKSIGNIKGYQITHTLQDIDGTTKITEFYTIKNNMLYSFSLCAEDAEYYSKVLFTMEKIIASVNI